MNKVKIGDAIYERHGGDVYYVTDIKTYPDMTWYQIDGHYWHTAIEMGDLFDLEYDELDMHKE